MPWGSDVSWCIARWVDSVQILKVRDMRDNAIVYSLQCPRSNPIVQKIGL